MKSYVKQEVYEGIDNFEENLKKQGILKVFMCI